MSSIVTAIRQQIDVERGNRTGMLPAFLSSLISSGDNSGHLFSIYSTVEEEKDNLNVMVERLKRDANRIPVVVSIHVSFYGHALGKR